MAALQRHPLAQALQKLLAVDLLIHSDPSQKQTLIERAVADWKDADAPALTALATWLNGKGEHERELETIPLERAVQTRELFLQRMDALGALGQWDEIRRLLENEHYPLDPVVQAMYLARTNAQLGNIAAAENNWQRALEAAGAEVGKLMALGDYSELNGALPVAQRAYERAVMEVPHMKPALKGLLRVVYRSRDTARIEQILARMLEISPEDAATLNDHTYIHLLLLPADAPTRAAEGMAAAAKAQELIHENRTVSRTALFLRLPICINSDQTMPWASTRTSGSAPMRSPLRPRRFMQRPSPSRVTYPRRSKQPRKFPAIISCQRNNVCWILP